MTFELFYSILHAAVNNPDRKKITSMEQYMDIMGIRDAFERAYCIDGAHDVNRKVYTGNDANLTFNSSII